MIYVASPYTVNLDKVAEGMQSTVLRNRFEYVELRLAQMLREGECAMSPIVMCHNLAIEYSMPKDFAFWGHLNRRMITACNKLVVLQMRGWEESIGVMAEIDHARTLGMEVEFLECPDYHEPDNWHGG